MYYGTICTCALHYCAVVGVGDLLRSGIDQRVGVAILVVLGTDVPGVVILGVSGLAVVVPGALPSWAEDPSGRLEAVADVHV